MRRSLSCTAQQHAVKRCRWWVAALAVRLSQGQAHQGRRRCRPPPAAPGRARLRVPSRHPPGSPAPSVGLAHSFVLPQVLAIVRDAAAL